jgi:3-phenylpropionate/trans-cinnamate dioxygenase ferredoxin reductase subunit
LGFDGEVILIGAEPVGPYHRPPLSKNLMKKDIAQPLLPQTFFQDQGIELRKGVGVVAIDRDARQVILHQGEKVGYDALILATGARARRLDVDGAELEKVYELRTLSDARVLHDVLAPGHHLAIVGGGWIGLEVAASALAAGVEVTVIEREDRLLARVASPELSRYLTDYHVARGTRLRTGVQVARLDVGRRGLVGAIQLEGGDTIVCDRVLIGIGAVADDALAREAGLRCDDGVVVDTSGRTDDPRIWAVGDVTRRAVPLHEGLLRVESIPSALEQARHAVASILGQPAPGPDVPWFWSDQFDLKLQIAGLLRGCDTTNRPPGLRSEEAGRLQPPWRSADRTRGHQRAGRIHRGEGADPGAGGTRSRATGRSGGALRAGCARGRHGGDGSPCLARTAAGSGDDGL